MCVIVTVELCRYFYIIILTEQLLVCVTATVGKAVQSRRTKKETDQS